MSSPAPRASLLNLGQQQAWMAPSLVLLYLSPLGVVPHLTKPGGVAESFVLPIFQRVFKLVGLGQIQRGRLPMALLAAGFFTTWIASAVGSIYGQTSGIPGGYANKEPRTRKVQLRGLAHRLCSAHDALGEFFPALVAATLAVQTLAPKGELNNALALATFAKCFIFPAAYAADLDLVRTAAHIFSVGTCLHIFLRLGFA